ncbi:hypothetical protein TIFTF001_054528, partial [Ficus carica]
MGMIYAVQHPHLVKLYGCCIEGDQLLLVYEYMENNNVARALFGPEKCPINLDWRTRRKICIGIARGLAYLHEESRLKIVHRDIKTTNVPFDKDFNPKISNFSLAKLDEGENTHISTRIAGTWQVPWKEQHYLPCKGRFLFSSRLGNYSERERRSNGASGSEVRFELREEVLLTIKVAILRTNVSAAARPTMSSVVSILEGKTDIQEIMINDTSVSKDEITAMRNHH